LIAVIGRYEEVGFDDPKPAKVQDYGDGIKCIRHVKPNYQGRCLFYMGDSAPGYQKLWILTIYKKETQEMPKQVLERAKSRKANHEAEVKKQQEKEQ